MSRLAKIGATVVLFIVVTVVSLIGVAVFQNWNLERQVRIAFALTGKHIDAEEIQKYLEKTFPVGTPKTEIERFLQKYFKATDFTTMTAAPNRQSLSYMVDCGSKHLGTRDRILLEFIFQTGSDQLQEIKAQDRSIAL